MAKQGKFTAEGQRKSIPEEVLNAPGKGGGEIL
jgi:hypothetical protein